MRLQAQLKALVSSAIAPAAERLGWNPIPGEPESDTLLRATALSLLAATSHQPTVDEAIKQFESGTYASDLRLVRPRDSQSQPVLLVLNVLDDALDNACLKNRRFPELPVA